MSVAKRSPDNLSAIQGLNVVTIEAVKRTPPSYNRLSHHPLRHSWLGHANCRSVVVAPLSLRNHLFLVPSPRYCARDGVKRCCLASAEARDAMLVLPTPTSYGRACRPRLLSCEFLCDLPSTIRSPFRTIPPAYSDPRIFAVSNTPVGR